ncbi:hypothetical protein [Candidatus Deianiraea vastatrix]|uniref:Uncharacterized protein n=1 Tax=Candidatus Deianiraea vastatrix TaxID=2163644 RepID=A0A5B8XIW7_9RICK|nr:hypothetical protein [Candidatus Deianiraea vastatrix]QED23901.1 hypothetical protein Deia_01120 [Candidatus Deianiraea vastatrix]
MNISDFLDKRNILLAKAILSSLDGSDIEKSEVIKFAISSFFSSQESKKSDISQLAEKISLLKLKSMNDVICVMLAAENIISAKIGEKIAYVFYSEKYGINEDLADKFVKEKCKDVGFIRYIGSKTYISSGFSVYFENLVLHNNLKNILSQIKANLMTAVDNFSSAV